MAKKIISLLFFLAAVGVFWFWSKPQILALNQLRMQKTVLDKALVETKELQKIRDNLLEKYNSITGEDLDRLGKIVPETAETIKLMVELTDIASQKGVVVKKFGSQEEASLAQAKENYKKLNLDIEVSASYEGFKSFMGELQKSLRLIDVHGISFSSSEGALRDFSIKAKAYYKN